MIELVDGTRESSGNRSEEEKGTSLAANGLRGSQHDESTEVWREKEGRSAAEGRKSLQLATGTST
jgi:hypothetical protein